MILATSATEARPGPLDSPLVQSAAVLTWRRAPVREIYPAPERHSIHSYFNACPESPDGRHVVYYTSSTRDAHHGELRLLERATGKETVLASGITAEDAHRAACQQWLAGGKVVGFHDFRDGRWVVAVVDVASGEERILAEDRQIGFGSPSGMWVPVYGAHWKQGAHRDLELVHVETGEIRQAIRLTDVLKDFGAEIVDLVGDAEVSIFFPVLSPDGSKVMFKIARGGGGDNFRSPAASERHGKFVYDLTTGKSIRFFRQWGHPSWTPDSAGILEKGQVLFDLATGKTRRHAPCSPSDHPSLSPDAALFVTDANISKRKGGSPGEWGVVVGCMESGEFATIHRFDQSHGAASWRKTHPHPVFSTDGRRIYYNVNDGPWTRLMVIESAGSL